MSVVKDPSRKSPWRVDWSEVDFTGKRKPRRNFFATKKEAVEFDAKKKLDTGRIGEHTRPTLKAAIDIWLETVKPRLEPQTWLGYVEKTAKVIEKIGCMPVDQVDRFVLANFRDVIGREGGKNKRPLSARTVNHVMVVLSTFFRFAMVEKGWVKENPCSAVERPKIASARTRKTRSLKRGEILAVLDAAIAKEAQNRMPAIALVTRVFLETGIRRSELLGLAVDALTMDEAGNPAVLVFRKVTLGHDKQPKLTEKTKTSASNRLIPISPELAEMLAEQRVLVQKMALVGGADYLRPLLLFPGTGLGDPLVPVTLTSRMRLVLKQAGIGKDTPLGPHLLRHTMGSHMVRSKETDIVTVSKRMGHSRVSTTLDIYAHSDDDAARQGANVATKIFQR